jgi:hypothetical protein
MALARSVLQKSKHSAVKRRYHDIMDWWIRFYKLNGIKASGVLSVQDKTVSQDELGGIPIVVLETLTLNNTREICRKFFPCWSYHDDLDQNIWINERDPKKGNYLIIVRDVIEADEDHRDKSADTIKIKSIHTETLLERMLHEIFSFSMRRRHLDVHRSTLCSGSRDRDGEVPLAGWNDKMFMITSVLSNQADKSLSSREIIG